MGEKGDGVVNREQQTRRWPWARKGTRWGFGGISVALIVFSFLLVAVVTGLSGEDREKEGREKGGLPMADQQPANGGGREAVGTDVSKGSLLAEEGGKPSVSAGSSVSAVKEEGAKAVNPMPSHHRKALLKYIMAKKMDDFFEYIKANEIDVNAPINDSGMRIVEMLFKRDFEAARRLVGMGARLVFEDRNMFLRLVGSSETDVVRFFLESGSVNLFDEDRTGEKALLNAARFGRTETLWLLSDAGVNLGPEDFVDHNPMNELSCSVKTNVECLAFLADQGAPIHTGHLEEAIRYGNLDTLRFFVERGVGLDEVNADGGNAMDLAVNSSRTDVAMIRYLEKEGLEIRPHHLEVARYNVKYKSEYDDYKGKENGRRVRVYHSYYPHADEVYSYIESALSGTGD